MAGKTCNRLSLPAKLGIAVVNSHGNVEALADLAARHHLKPVHIAELYCGSCGFFRLGVPSPAFKLACPECGTLRPATALGMAYTARPGPLVRYLWRAVPKLAHFWDTRAVALTHQSRGRSSEHRQLARIRRCRKKETPEAHPRPTEDLNPRLQPR